DTLYNPSEIDVLPGYTEEISEVDYYHSSGYFNHKGLTKERLQNITAKYYGLITQIDDEVGRIIQKLKDEGLYDNTTIIYTSDHGDYMGYHHMLLKANYMYDSLAKIPLIIKYPKGTNEGVINHHMSSNIDVAKTILESAGITGPHTIKGMNLVDEKADRGMVICEGLRVDHHLPGQEFYYEYMIRSKDFKVIVHKDFKTTRAFDLAKDPMELCDIATQPEYAQRIKQHLDFLAQTLVFDSIRPIYLNYDEQIISPDKQRDKARFDASKKYYWEQTVEGK
ncbi:MAG: sulfatase-like hydrolase/transferase, partial [Cellulosilyticaceae bacterium]